MERSGVASCSHGVDDWNDLLRVITLRNIAAAARENCSKSNGDPARLRANSSLRSSEESREQLPSSGCTYGQPLGASRGLDNPASGQNVSGFKPQREYSRPSCSYTCLIGMALLTSSSGSLTVSDIYKSIEERFPYYKISANPAWKNSVRHSLSLCQIFRKVEKDPNVLSWQAKKGHNWEVAPLKKPTLLLEVNKGLREAGVRMKLVENGQCYQLVKISALPNQTGRSLPIVVASPALPNVVTGHPELATPRHGAVSQMHHPWCHASQAGMNSALHEEGHSQVDLHLLKACVATNAYSITAQVTTPLTHTTDTVSMPSHPKPPKPKLPSKTEANLLKIASNGLYPCGIIPLKPDSGVIKALNLHPQTDIETFANNLLVPVSDSTTTGNGDGSHASTSSKEVQNVVPASGDTTPLSRDKNTIHSPSLGIDAEVAEWFSQSAELSVPGNDGVELGNAFPVMGYARDYQNAHALPKRRHDLISDLNYTSITNSLYSASRSGMTVADRTVLETELAEKTCHYIDPTHPLMKRTLTQLYWHSNPSLNAQFSETTPFNHFKPLTLHFKSRQASQITAPFGGGFSNDTSKRCPTPPIEYGDELDDYVMAKANASDLQAPDSEVFDRLDLETSSMSVNDDKELSLFGEKQNKIQKPSNEDCEELCSRKSRKRPRLHNEEDRLAVGCKWLNQSTQSSGEFPAYVSLSDNSTIQSDIATRSQVFADILLDIAI